MCFILPGNYLLDTLVLVYQISRLLSRTHNDVVSECPAQQGISLNSLLDRLSTTMSVLIIVVLACTLFYLMRRALPL